MYTFTRYFELYKHNQIIKLLVDNYVKQHDIDIWIDCENPFINVDLGQIIMFVLR